MDEVEALGIDAQSSFLRLMQDKTFRPLGQTRDMKANVRVIAATNMDLKKRISSGLFRSDLFYRFTVIIDVPPLRDRKMDIPMLATHFLERYCEEYNRDMKTLSDNALARLLNYDWPGNIRELENVIQEAILYTQGKEITRDDLNLSDHDANSNGFDGTFKEAKIRAAENFEKQYLAHLLERSNGNITRAAHMAGKDRSDLGKLIRKHGIDLEDFRVR